MIINCIAIDDEPLALDVIENHCQQLPYLSLKKKFTSAIEAVEYLQRESIDLIFLDINMPTINGLNLKTFIADHIQIIFITAYEQHALESYEIGAIDYLLKPVSFERFFKAAEKCKNQLKTTDSNKNSITKPEPTLFVRSDKKLIQIRINDIIYVEGLKDYAKIYLVNNERIVIRESLQNILSRISNYHFVKTHRSYIVALDKISYLSGNQIHIESTQIPISRNHKSTVLELLRAKGVLGERKE